MLRMSLTLVRVRGHSQRLSAFAGSMESVFPSTMTPKYSMCVCSKTHFDRHRKYDSLARRSKTASTILRCRLTSFLVAIRMLSIYTNNSVGNLSVRGQNILAIALQKVAGELVSPKNITVGWNSPRGVLNAAFHWSSSRIRMFSYPHRMSNLVNSSLPWRCSRMVFIRGKGYSSLTVHELRTQ